MNYEASCGAKYGTLSSGDRGGVGFEALIRSKGRRADGSKKNRVRFVSYLGARGGSGAHLLCFGTTKVSVVHVLSITGHEF